MDAAATIPSPPVRVWVSDDGVCVVSEDGEGRPIHATATLERFAEWCDLYGPERWDEMLGAILATAGLPLILPPAAIRAAYGRRGCETCHEPRAA